MKFPLRAIKEFLSKKATVKSYTKIKIDVQIKGKAKCLEHVYR